MKKIILPPCEGKTERLIKINAQTEFIIICVNRARADAIYERAEKYSLFIPPPMSFYDFILHRYRDMPIKGILIDDADELLQSFFSCKIEAITMTDENDLISINIPKEYKKERK